MAKALALLLLATLPATAAADPFAAIVATIDGARRRLEAHEGGGDDKCDMKKASDDMQKAAMDMAKAGKDCGKIEKAHKAMKAAISDNGCEETFKDNQGYQTSLKQLEDAMEQAGCNTSDGAQGTLVSIPLVAAVAFLVH